MPVECGGCQKGVTEVRTHSHHIAGHFRQPGCALDWGADSAEHDVIASTLNLLPPLCFICITNSFIFVVLCSHMVSLPKLTPEGYRLLCYRLSDTDPSRMNFAEAVKTFCMFNDVQISKDGPIEGYIVIFDMKGVRLGHLARVQFGPLRTFMSYIQDAHPVRLKKIYIVHTASFINQVMALVKPLIRSELLGLLQFCTSGPIDILGADLLPKVSNVAINPTEMNQSKAESPINDFPFLVTRI